MRESEKKDDLNFLDEVEDQPKKNGFFGTILIGVVVLGLV